MSKSKPIGLLISDNQTISKTPNPCYSECD